MPSRADRQSGFLLVGVVMFVLALTILGLSLYSLSSYESGFQAQSSDANAAYYRAQGGMAMVQAVLARPTITRLDSAWSVVGHQGVTSAIARQWNGHDSVQAGPINFDSTVTIIVSASANGSTRTLQANYLPGRQRSYYKRLFTIARAIDCASANVNGQNIVDHVRIPTLESVWQGDADSSWADVADFPRPRLITRRTDIPLPPDSLFIATHSNAPGTIVPQYDAGDGDLNFTNNNVQPAYFRMPSGSMVTPQYDCRLGGVAKQGPIKVRGVCIWLVPRGVRFEKPAVIRNDGGTTPTLVIVAGPNGRDLIAANPPTPAQDYRDVGIWFFGGLQVDAGVNLVLVSRGRVEIDQGVNGFDSDGWAANLSVYAGDLSLIGPYQSTNPTVNRYSTLGHGTTLDAVIDALKLQGALPVPTGTPDSFTLVRGSWRDLTP